MCARTYLRCEQDLHRKSGLLKIKCDQIFCKHFSNYNDDDGDDDDDDNDDNDNDDDDNDNDDNDNDAASKKT